MEHEYTFYALNVNNVRTIAIFNTKEEALKELVLQLQGNEVDTFSIEPICGIWHTLERLADFESRSDDDWVENVIYMISQMIANKKKVPCLKEDSPEENKQE